MQTVYEKSRKPGDVDKLRTGPITERKKEKHKDRDKERERVKDVSSFGNE